MALFEKRILINGTELKKERQTDRKTTKYRESNSIDEY